MATQDEASRRAACLNLLYLATVHARSLSWGGQGSFFSRFSRRRYDQIADLMTAVHNIPQLLDDAARFDDERLRRDLRTYDDKWSKKYPLSLLDCYEAGLRGDFSSFG